MKVVLYRDMDSAVLARFWHPWFFALCRALDSYGNINMNDTIFYSSLMLLAGIGIPLMAALNGRLGVKLQCPALVAKRIFLVGLAIFASYLLVVEGVPTANWLCIFI